METTYQFDNLTWADLTVIDDELKAVLINR